MAERDDLIAALRLALDDAAPRLDAPADELSVMSWMQLWSDTACGFDRAGAQALTGARTVVVIHRGEACVYHAGRFAYQAPARLLQEGLTKQRLPGAAEWARQHAIR